MQRIALQNAQVLLRKDAEKGMLLDSRLPHDFHAYSIPGSINIPFEEIRIRFAEIEKKNNIICVGYTQNWSDSTAQQLIARGIRPERVYSLECDVERWRNGNQNESGKGKTRHYAVLIGCATVLFSIIAIGYWTKPHLCCRLTRGAIGSMECHWYDASRGTSVTTLSATWKNLQRVKEGRLRCTEDTSDAFDKLYADAKNILPKKPVSVLQKDMLPPSGDRRDFLSLSRYYWPNKNTPNGLPYERRDGVTNPEIYNNSYDKRAMEAMIDRVRILTLAYFFFEEERFAAKAAEQLHVWFVDDKTSMTPHLRYASYIPGQSTGRGLVPLHELPDLLDAARILAATKVWTAKDEEGFRLWMSSYYTWITEDPQGQGDRLLRNNRGTWYEAQAAALELYLGNTSAVKNRLEQARLRRLSVQFEPDGSQPLELERTKPWLYSTYNLQAWMILADIGEQVGTDLWGYVTSDKKSLRTAMEQLVSYSAGRKAWPHKDPVNDRYLYPLLRRSAAHYDTPALQMRLEQLEKNMSFIESVATLRWPAD